MSATKESWHYANDEKVWVGTYKNSQNSLHWHSDCELIFAERGSLDVVCDGKTYLLGEHDSMFIGSGEMHRIHAHTPDTLLKTVIFDNGIISEFASDIKLVSPILAGEHCIPDFYGEILRELTEKAPLYRYKTAAETELLMLDIFSGEQTEQKKPRNKTDARFKALLSEIQNRYDTFVLKDAASFMGMNESYLSRYFTERTGMHFMRYVNAVRVEKAAEMLSRGDETVTEIAARCGFGTIRNFNRIFKLLTGYTPSALPADFVYTPSAADRDIAGSDPTLLGCELVECSSPVVK